MNVSIALPGVPTTIRRASRSQSPAILMSLLFMALLLAGSARVNAAATAWTVDSSAGSACTTADPNCTTIQDAVTAATSGDSIHIVGVLDSGSPPAPIPYDEHVDTQSKNLSFQGDGADITIIDGTGGGTIFTIAAGTVSLDGIGLENGYAASNGGGISNAGMLTLSHCVLIQNIASDAGGAVYNSGTLVVQNCTFTGNTATLGNALANIPPGSDPTVAHATITDSTFDQNVNPTLAVFPIPPVPTSGGAVENQGIAEVSTSTFSGNVAGQGGALDNNGLTISGVSATFTSCTFSNNDAYTNVSFLGSDSIILGSGRAIDNTDAILRVHNSTFFYDSNVFLSSDPSPTDGSINSTTDSSAPAGATPEVQNTLFSTVGPNCTGTITSLGHNLDSDGSCGFSQAGDQNGTAANPLDPKLSALQDNGGPTLTHALLFGSPAIDTGDPTDAPVKDQRGLPRVDDGNADGTAVIDIGAFEVQKYVVDTPDETTPPGTLTLRQAILNNNAAGGGLIAFGIPDTGDPKTIEPTTALPEITKTVTIDGTTEPVDNLITINSVNQAPDSSSNYPGLILKAGYSTIRGLSLLDFDTAIDLIGPNVVYTRILGNFIGTDTTNRVDFDNLVGVAMEGGANHNIIGGTSAGDRNVLSGNDIASVILTHAGTSNNLILGNYIGTTVDGSDSLLSNSNVASGIALFDGASNNVIGGEAAGSANVISGFGNAGIFMRGTGVTANAVLGNLIGVNAAQTDLLGNFDAIAILDDANGNTIGGSNAADRNVILGDTTGIDLEDVANTTIQGNLIGVASTAPLACGCPSVGALVGIAMGDASGTQIGGIDPGAGNQISGNFYGIVLSGTGTTGTLIKGNLIGTDSTGTAPVGNLFGIEFDSGANGNTIGGTSAAARNVISGNSSVGVLFSLPPFGPGTTPSGVSNTIIGNYIGTNVTGSAALPNGLGVMLNASATNNAIGTHDVGGGNVISGNSTNEVVLTDDAGNNSVQGNLIGLNAAGNAILSTVPDEIILEFGASGNIIGSDGDGTNDAAERNQIAGGTRGITMFNDPGTTSNLLSNLVFSHLGLGIDLGEDGPTPNDAADNDSDSGPNELQDYPVITGVANDGTITGSLTGANLSNYHIEFFASTACNDSGFGEGEAFLGSTNVTTSGSGVANFTVPSTLPAGKTIVTSTATDVLAHTTSEFSRCVGVGDQDGDGIADASDNCPTVFNPLQTDRDGNGTGDSCEAGAPDLSVLISEFRLRGPAGPEDEFVELYNNTDASTTVHAADGSGGWSLVSSGGTEIAEVSDGTTIPPRGHYLIANDNTTTGYSLNAYALPDYLFNGDIPDGSGLALFKSTDPVHFTTDPDPTLNNRLDAVGYSGSAPLYRIGDGFPMTGREIGTNDAADADANLEYSFIRTIKKELPSNLPDNLADFIMVETGGDDLSLPKHLGEPGPENLASPMQRNRYIRVVPLDNTQPASLAPNRSVDYSGTIINGSHYDGTVVLRRKITNIGNKPIVKLLLRVADITTFPSPVGTSDVRAETIADLPSSDPNAIIVSGSPVTVLGTTLESLPGQTIGGGFNSSLLVLGIDAAHPLGVGQSVNIQVLLGLAQLGSLFRFNANFEALP